MHHSALLHVTKCDGNIRSVRFLSEGLTGLLEGTMDPYLNIYLLLLNTFIFFHSKLFLEIIMIFIYEIFLEFYGIFEITEIPIS